MNVLHDVNTKTSLGRPIHVLSDRAPSSTNNLRSASRLRHELSPSSPQKQQTADLMSSTSSASTLTQPKAPCLSETSLKSSSSPSCTPDPDPYLISEPQPSAYWSGRFMSLYDKFKTEVLVPIPEGLAASQMNSTSHGQSTKTRLVYHPTQLPHATTTSALMNIACTTPARNTIAQDEGEITRRVFRHLEVFCSTDEARASLHEWQQAYAKLTKQPHLIPPKHPKVQAKATNRWFGSGKRSFSALKEAAAQRVSAKRVVTEKVPQTTRPQASGF